MADTVLASTGGTVANPRAVRSYDSAGQGSMVRDQIALLTIFFIVVVHHIQNPLLQFELQFGRAFRNATLQPVLTLALLGCSILLIGNLRVLRQNPIRLAAAVGLGLYVLYEVVAIILRFNVLGAVLGIPQELYLDQLEDTAPRNLFEIALTISTLFEYLALFCVIILWTPWTRLALYRRAFQRSLPVLMVAITVLVLWETLINVLQIQEFLLPKPSTISLTFIDIYPRLISVSWNTFQNAVWGFAVGCGLGVLIGMISARFTSFSKALLPLAIAANSVPIIAFAPIINNWFGALNPASKVAIVAILTFFPAMISTVRGLTSANTTSLELMKSYAANEFEIFHKLRFPSALPFIFSSLKVATTLSMIGAIVSEYFGGTTQGLGYRIREDAANFKYPEAWAAIIVASLLGILFYALVSAAERAIMPWHVSFRDE